MSFVIVFSLSVRENSSPADFMSQIIREFVRISIRTRTPRNFYRGIVRTFFPSIKLSRRVYIFSKLNFNTYFCLSSFWNYVCRLRSGVLNLRGFVLHDDAPEDQQQDSSTQERSI